MPLIARQRSRLAVLAVLALVGSLLAVSAAPAAAADKKVTYPATYSACVGAATDDAGLGDMDGHAFENEANCLAHYNITKGTSEGVYSPNESVTRLQMALFLVRAAGPAGIELLEPAVDQGFGDIDGYTTEIQDAINQIAEEGIMSGTSDDAFSPDGMVSRADMAVFLDKFVEAAPIGPGGLDGLAKFSDIDTDKVDDPFDDVGGVSFGSYNAIRRVYELGIAKGNVDSSGEPDGTFSPSALITRGQMAAFITRALAHTNARPAGVSIQSDEMSIDENGAFELQVSVRNDDRSPAADAVIDLFSASSADAAFDDDGLCVDVVDGATDPAEQSERCEIDAGDVATDSDGNYTARVDVSSGDYCSGNTKWIWAWTGDIGDDFDSDDTDAAMVGVGVTKAAASLKDSTDAKANATHVPFGTTVTFSVQVIDGDKDPVSQADLDVRLDESRMDADGMTIGTRVHSLKTDASGQVSIPITINDPDADEDSGEVTVTVNRRTGFDGELLTDDSETTDRDESLLGVEVGSLTWSDDKAAASTLILSQSVAYHETSAKSVRNSVTATLLDQYGDPVSGAPIHFWSNANNSDTTAGVGTANATANTDNDGLGGAETRPSRMALGETQASDGAAGSARTCTGTNADGACTGYSATANEENPKNGDSFRSTVKTGRNGAAQQSYRRTSTAVMHEEIGAVYAVGERDGEWDATLDTPEPNTEADDIYGDADADTDGSQNMSHYWAPALAGGTSDEGTVLVADTDANVIVIDTDDQANVVVPALAKYDSNDNFHHDEAVADTADGVKQDTFEKGLEADDNLVITLARDPEPGVNTFRNEGAEVPVAPTCHD